MGTSTGSYKRRAVWVVRYLWMGSLVWCILGFFPGGAGSAPAEELYDQLITVTAQRHGLAPVLVKALIKCESNFDPRAQSPKGAQGLMQLMPATQALLGVTNGFDPQLNIAGGVRYLAMLKQLFNGNVLLMLAGYNAGPQAVIDAGYTVPPFAETQGYVRCVFDMQRRYQQSGLPLYGASLHTAPLYDAPLPLPYKPRRPVPKTVTTTTRAEASSPLVVRPLRFSSRTAQLGQRFTVQLEALNTSRYPAHGVVMLNYPEHLVSFIALHTTASETTVQLSAAEGTPTQATPPVLTYQLLLNHWPVWRPGERRTAVIAMVPRLPQDLAMHLSVVLDTPAKATTPQRWSSVVRIPFRTAMW